MYKLLFFQKYLFVKYLMQKLIFKCSIDTINRGMQLQINVQLIYSES